jgi:aminopeptidase N
MYNKGGNMLHTLRQLVDNDQKWRMILRKMNKKFYHQTVTTNQIEAFLSRETALDLTPFFNQYLRSIEIPTLEYKVENDVLIYKWTAVVKDFKMPLKVFINQEPTWIYPTSEIQKKSLTYKKSTLEIDPNFYVYSKEVQ